VRTRAALVVDADGAKIIAPRFIRLLEEIRVQGSVRQAAKALGLGHRHAIAWIQRAEATLARPLVVRRTGGSAGGGSGLTLDGVRLVQSYRRLSRALERIVIRAEREIFGE
jgi:molybdate transport system regulatory protein